MKKIILIFLFPVLMSLLKADIGETGIPVLMMDGYGARQAAMADAFTGLSDDIYAMSVNPAGLDTLSGIEAAFMYMNYLEDMSFNFLALSYSSAIGCLGLGMATFAVREFDNYDSEGNFIGPLNADDLALFFSYATSPLKFFGIKQDLHAGINLKIVSTTLAEETRRTMAMDLGFLYRMDLFSLGMKKDKNLSFGLCVQNIGPSVNFGETDTSLPFNFRLGAGYRFYNQKKHSVLFASDLNIPNDSSAILSTGFEYSYLNMIQLRGGYKLSKRQIDSYTFGAGIRYRIKDLMGHFDYALVPRGELGFSHILSLTLKRGNSQD